MNNMFDTLTQRMTRIVKTLRGEARLTESNMQQMLREVRLALLEADVALPVVRAFRSSQRKSARRGSHPQSNARPGACRHRAARTGRRDGRRCRRSSDGTAAYRRAARDHSDGGFTGCR